MNREVEREHARRSRQATRDLASWAVFLVALLWAEMWLVDRVLEDGYSSARSIGMSIAVPLLARLSIRMRARVQPWRFPVAPLREPGERTVRLTSWGKHRMRVLWTVYMEASTGLGWKELGERKDAKSPLVVRAGLADEAAMDLGLLLEGHGATVVIE
ncbi:hypothetical protein [Demequina gelatinilytica]|uniref:hypothetical protein n=1 Tax=Demequina gelatinilytica TaxID=1638980 RepID=UPI000783F9FC|nr:hypothetical protein [Demequina gelatinilytica]